MKRLVCALTTLLVLASTQVMASDTRNFTYQQSDHGGMIMPGNGSHSGVDLNHRGSGSDKSDELGVPYYHGEG